MDQVRGGVPVYRGRKLRDPRGMFETDHADNTGGRFRWLVSTCLAAAVGAVAILVVVYGASDSHDGGLMPALKRIRDQGGSATARRPQDDSGLKWASPKSDLMQSGSGSASTRFVIHDTVKQRRNNREYIWAKPYVRIVSRLGPVPSTYADVVPPFNPFKLYANSQPIGAGETEPSRQASAEVQFKVVELLGGILPGEDGQELETQEVSEIVQRTQENVDAGRDEPIEAPVAAAEPPQGMSGRKVGEAVAPNTSNLAKTGGDGDDTSADIEGRETRIVTVAKKEDLKGILARAGAEPWQAAEMVTAARGIFPESAVAPGQEVHLTVVPSLTDPSRMDPVQFSVFGEGHSHLVTVARNSAGEFVASATPSEDGRTAAAAAGDDGEQTSHTTSLYAAIYAAGLLQSTPPETINQILRIHAYDTDFRRRVRPGDQIETFYDAREDVAADGPPGELLYTAVTVAGDTSRFYRFRTPDGVVDYYDEQGNNSKKFLMRRPVRSEDVRLVSGYGVRFHPLLQARKMHTGVDWAAPTGTPVMAAGTGVVEEAGRKSGYGNYVRIRHANGYQTAYGHNSRFAPGLVPGAKVRQGQTIAYVGCTGLCQGPHVHFEVLVNNRFVDPMSIQVPRERKLTGKLLMEFQKERARIDDLMHRAPVMTASKG